MIYLQTGTPGASKTLNTIKTICEDDAFADRKIYYHNIKCLALDLDFLNSFEGFFYCDYLFNCSTDDRKRLSPIISHAHKEGRLVSMRDVAFLRGRYEAYQFFECFLFWVKRLYPASRYKSLIEYIDNSKHFKYEIQLEDLRSFNLDFIYFPDPFLWYELPAGSVILVDEIQDFYCKRSPMAKTPKYIELFNRHRHFGFDLLLITQSSSLIDYQLKECVGRHTHYKNRYGGDEVLRFDNGGHFNVTSSTELAAVHKIEKIKKDKNFYGAYWSAEMHTHKYRMPQFMKKIFVWVPLVFVFSYIAYVSVFSLFDKTLDLSTSSENKQLTEQINEMSSNDKNKNDIQFDKKNPNCIILSNGKPFCI